MTFYTLFIPNVIEMSIHIEFGIDIEKICIDIESFLLK
jgi:hypothetical protein